MGPLWQITAAAGLNGRTLADESGSFPLAALAGHGMLADRNKLVGAVVLLRSSTQRATALALMELDGLASRIVLCTPDLSADQIEAAAHISGASAVVTDRAEDPTLSALRLPIFRSELEPQPAAQRPQAIGTEWALFTSGTSGAPKLAVHTLGTLTAAFRRPAIPQPKIVWSTFYDIRRYGGLQILLRALIGGGSMVLSGADDPTPFLERAAKARVTYLSGTPTHWRRALLSAAAPAIALADVRLSGEVADQTILDKLRALYPEARICHAFASTEAGLGFEVQDGLAGFPSEWLQDCGAVTLRVCGGTLRIRGPGRALRYLGTTEPLMDHDGFVDTRDLVTMRGDRLHFAGRSDGVINVGGLKVNPVEVEEVVGRHPRVALARARSRGSPIIGQVVVVDVVPREPEAGTKGLEAEILAFCRQSLAPHKVPAMVRFRPALEVNAAGKVLRTGD